MGEETMPERITDEQLETAWHVFSCPPDMLEMLNPIKVQSIVLKLIVEVQERRMKEREPCPSS